MAGISFRYPGASDYALRDINLRIGPNENIAIVGENGAGKTTLVKLLCKFYEPTEGNIFLDGKNLAEYDILEYRQMISAIFQDFGRFYFSAYENIGIGNISQVDDISRIEMAAERSGIHSDMRSLPLGYNTILGKLFDDGQELSMGQWQKLAIARALMRESMILILDEPTSSVDAKTEFEIFSRFSELTKERLSVLISHRFSTVCMADRIIVLDRGRIIEQGTHPDLMRLRGKYCRMFEMQAARYVQWADAQTGHLHP
jgi:ATP-binding cassette subfamily B protein